MKADAWECGHRMPFIARWPGHVPPGSASQQIICFTDFLATFADLLDQDLPAGAAPDSVSFLAALTGKQPDDKPIRQHLVIRSGGPLMTIREGPWKLINGLGSSGFSQPKRIPFKSDRPRGQLYHLGNDLGETTNLYQERPEVVARLEAKLKEIIDQP